MKKEHLSYEGTTMFLQGLHREMRITSLNSLARNIETGSSITSDSMINPIVDQLLSKMSAKAVTRLKTRAEHLLSDFQNNYTSSDKL